MRFRVASVQSAAAAMMRCGFPDSRTSLSRSSIITGPPQEECKGKVSPTNLILVDDQDGVDQLFPRAMSHPWLSGLSGT